MQLSELLLPHIQEFILSNEGKDPVQLMLSASNWKEAVPFVEVVKQIQSRQKALQKAPSLAGQKGILYPPPLSLEQSSSEATAQLKVEILRDELKEFGSIADLTAGFGIDSFAFAGLFKKVYYNEAQEVLLKIAAHNASILGLDHIIFQQGKAEDILSTLPSRLDCIFLDPSRRDEQNRKKVLLEDCEPNVISLLPFLLEKTDTIFLKLSPMLDISLAVRELSYVTKVFVLALDQEVKELLFLLEKNKSIDYQVHSIHLTASKKREEFCFVAEEEKNTEPVYSLAKRYLYEPNGSVMKSGGFKILAKVFNLSQLHPNTHLYTSEQLVTDFPGRKFEIQSIGKYSKKEISTQIPSGKANITARNFPDSVPQIRKKTGLREGGEVYIFAIRNIEEELQLIMCRKIT